MAFTIPSSDEALAPTVQSQIFETDLSILVAALSQTGVVSGCGVTAQGSPDMTVAVASGTILAAGVSVAVTSGNLTVGAADATNPRVDLISASAAGVKTITAGVAAATASVKPPDLPSGHIGLAFVYVAANDTAINTNEITDKRAIVAAVTGTTVTNQLSSNVAMNSGANTYVDGPAVTLSIGTWLLVGVISCGATGGAGGKFFAKLWDGSTVAASAQGESDEATGTGHNAIPLTGLAVISSGTPTWKISACSDGGSANLNILAAMSANSAGNTASTLVAVKIA